MPRARASRRSATPMRRMAGIGVARVSSERLAACAVDETASFVSLSWSMPHSTGFLMVVMSVPPELRFEGHGCKWLDAASGVGHEGRDLPCLEVYAWDGKKSPFHLPPL